MFRLLVMTVALQAAACAAAAPSSPPPSPSSPPIGTNGRPGATPTLSFNADFTTTQSGPLVAGGQVIVRFDLSRLSSCVAESGGNAVWGVTGYAQFDDGTTTALTLSQLQGAQVAPVPATLALPADATSVALWFTQTNTYGCIAYDSNNSQNYTYSLQRSGGGGGGGAAAVIAFPSSISDGPTQSAAITAGSRVIVQYDPNRLAQCATVGNDGSPAWGVTMSWQVDGGAVQTAQAAVAQGDALVAADPAIAIPQGTDLAMWFEATNIYGCDAFDSAYGANYQFAIE